MIKFIIVRAGKYSCEYRASQEYIDSHQISTDWVRETYITPLFSTKQRGWAHGIELHPNTFLILRRLQAA